MDIITHSLFAYSISSTAYNIKRVLIISLFIGAIIPDIGEVFIQKELSKKYGATIAVYDERTSDAVVASNLEVTFIYDVLHSIILPITILVLSFYFYKYRSIARYFSLGVFSHIFLDSFTHGKIWALKLFYPLVNKRFEILSNSIGNWWDWTPKINLYYFKLPTYCLLIWTILLIYIIIQKKRKIK